MRRATVGVAFLVAILLPVASAVGSARLDPGYNGGELLTLSQDAGVGNPTSVDAEGGLVSVTAAGGDAVRIDTSPSGVIVRRTTYHLTDSPGSTLVAGLAESGDGGLFTSFITGDENLGAHGSAPDAPCLARLDADGGVRVFACGAFSSVGGLSPTPSGGLEATGSGSPSGKGLPTVRTYTREGEPDPAGRNGAFRREPGSPVAVSAGGAGIRAMTGSVRLASGRLRAVTELVARRADGSLDESYGHAGRRRFGREYSAVAVDARGRLVLGRPIFSRTRARLELRRLTTSGADDQSFGRRGIARPGRLDRPGRGLRLLATPDGGVVAVMLDGIRRRERYGRVLQRLSVTRVGPRGGARRSTGAHGTARLGPLLDDLLTRIEVVALRPNATLVIVAWSAPLDAPPLGLFAVGVDLDG